MLYNFEDMADLLGDELLTQEVTETAVSKAEQWLYVLADRLGVSKDKVIRSFTIKLLESRITPEQLTGNPTEYKGYRSVEIYRG